MATRFSDPNRFLDSLGVIGEGGAGDRNVLRTGPLRGGVAASLLCTDYGVRGHRAGYILRGARMGVYKGGGEWSRSPALALVTQCLQRLGWAVVVGKACRPLARPYALVSVAVAWGGPLPSLAVLGT